MRIEKAKIGWKGLWAGIAAGICGAVLWGVLAFFCTNFEIGWLAWGIGAAVGAAVAWGSEGNSHVGAAAVTITVLSILAGKYLPVEVSLFKEVRKAKQDLVWRVKDDEYMIGCLADEIMDVSEGQGHSVTYTFNPENILEIQKDYSEELWQQAKTKWDSMSAAEKETYRAQVRQQTEESIVAFFSLLRKDNFSRSLDGIDIVFFVLGNVTAYNLAAKKELFKRQIWFSS